MPSHLNGSFWAMTFRNALPGSVFALQSLFAKMRSGRQLANELLRICLLVQHINVGFSLDNDVKRVALASLANNVLVPLVRFAVGDVRDFGNFIVGEMT